MTYNLHSTGFVFTPGIIAWAIAGARTSPSKMAQLIADTYSIPKPIARALVTEKIAYSVTGDIVTFEA